MEGNRGRVFRSGPQRSRRALQASKSKIAEQCRNGHADQEKVLISNEPPGAPSARAVSGARRTMAPPRRALRTDGCRALLGFSRIGSGIYGRAGPRRNLLWG